MDKGYRRRILTGLLLSSVLHVFLANGFMNIPFYLREIPLSPSDEVTVVIRPVPLPAPSSVFNTNTSPPGGISPGVPQRKSPSVGAKGPRPETGIQETLPDQPFPSPASPSLSLDQTGLLKSPEPSSLQPESESETLSPTPSFDPYRAPESSSLRDLMRERDRKRVRRRQQRSPYITGAGGETVSLVAGDNFEYGDPGPEGGWDITPWARQVMREIMEGWKSMLRPDSPGTAWAEVGFLPDGNLVKLEIIRSSQNPLFDNLVRQALLINVPYPPLPENLSPTPLVVTIEFSHEK